jgi:hypothetical protein
MDVRVRRAFAETGVQHPVWQRAELIKLIDHLRSQGMRKVDIARGLQVPDGQYCIWDRGLSVPRRLERLLQNQVNRLQSGDTDNGDVDVDMLELQARLV